MIVSPFSIGAARMVRCISLSLRTLTPQAVVLVSENIGNMHDAAFQHSAARRRASILLDWVLFHLLEKFMRVTETGGNSINVPILSVDEAQFGAT